MTKDISPSLLKKMTKLASAVRDKAYAPYSGYHVGVALLAENGKIFTGANCETANYKSNCAERSAITAMTSAGQRKIKALVVAGPEKDITTPCGACRQDIREFAALDAPIYCINLGGSKVEKYSLAGLLPDSFGPDNLRKGKKQK